MSFIIDPALSCIEAKSGLGRVSKQVSLLTSYIPLRRIIVSYDVMFHVYKT